MALEFYCGKIKVDMTAIPEDHVPTIIAANHPNAYLDALIIAAYYRRPLKFMAKGDAFKNPLAAWLFKALGLIPYYAGGVAANNAFYTMCVAELENGGSLLVFPEGISEHTDNVRPLRKPVATLVHKVIQANIEELRIVPVYLRYSSFGDFPEAIHVHTCTPETLYDISESSPAAFTAKFNQQLSVYLEDCRVQATVQASKPSTDKNQQLLWALPGMIGYAIHWPLVSIVKIFCSRYKKREGAYYDSMLFTLLAILYPLILVAGMCISVALSKPAGILSIVIAPFTAWTYKKYKASK